jgi:S-adenosylmethionine decarboxylase proenzyme
MKRLGTHLLVEMVECDRIKLNDVDFIKDAMLQAANAAGATTLNSYFHQFSPQGVSGAVIVAESHLTIHSWPELGYAAIDIFTCGDTCKPWKAVAYLRTALEGIAVEVKNCPRGFNLGPSGNP